jgi:CHASE1-domain containing sensor protein
LRSSGPHALAIPARSEAAERAMLTGEVTLTGKVTLVQAQQSGPGFLDFVAIYRRGARATTPSERREALQGWVYMPVIAAEVLQGAAEAAEGELDFELFEGRELSLAGLIYDDDSHLKSSGTHVRESFRDRAFLAFSSIEVGGQYWTMTLSTSPRFRAEPRTAVWAIALAGIALSLLLGLYARSYTRT